MTRAERTYQDAAHYLLDNGWRREGEDSGLWLDPIQAPNRKWMIVGYALVTQWERDGVSMLSAVGVSGGTPATAPPSLPESDLLSRETGLALIRAYNESRSSVGRLEEALRAAHDSPYWSETKEIIAAALAGGTPPPGEQDAAEAGGTATPLPVAEEGRNV